MNIRTLLATAGLAVAVTVGGATAASAATGSSTATPSPEKIAERCTKVPTVLERIAAAEEKATANLARLTEARTAAEADGKTRRVERLTKAIDRLETRLDRLETARGKAQAWADTNCSAPAGSTPTGSTPA